MIYRCLNCGNDYNKNPQKYFYKAKNGLYEKNNGFMPLCKSCIMELCDKYMELYEGDEKLVIRHMCMLLDLYYCDKLVEQVIASSNVDNSTFSLYMQRLNMRQYKGKTYISTYLEEQKKVEKYEKLDEVQNQNPVPEETIRRFGEGYSYKDYKFLQDEYNDWTTRHECKTKSQEEIFIRLSCTKLAIVKKQAAGESTKDLERIYQDLLGVANLQPKQMKDGSATEGKTLSLLIKEWENKSPIIMKDKSFEDVDHIQDYVDVFFKGGLASGVGLKGNFFSKRYKKIMDKLTAVRKENQINDDDYSSDSLYSKIFGDDLE